jgi:tRNA(Ile)-lysidine synthase
MAVGMAAGMTTGMGAGIVAHTSAGVAVGAERTGIAAIVRPLLGVRRAAVAAYAAKHCVRFMDDPTNTDRAYLRNRLRADLLAAAERVRPGFVDELLAIGARAAGWRNALATLVDQCGVAVVAGGAVVPVDALAGLSLEGLAIVWPEIAARAGVVLDRRGVERLAAWSQGARAGQRIPLAGGATVERTGRTFVVRAG